MCPIFHVCNHRLQHPCSTFFILTCSVNSFQTMPVYKWRSWTTESSPCIAASGTSSRNTAVANCPRLSRLSLAWLTGNRYTPVVHSRLCGRGGYSIHIVTMLMLQQRDGSTQLESAYSYRKWCIVPEQWHLGITTLYFKTTLIIRPLN